MNDRQHQQQKKAQLRSMEMQRFGFTRDEVFAAKGAYCHHVLTKGDYHQGTLVISHEKGGGRHATETGQVIPGKTHNMANLTVLCQRHDGMKDRLRSLAGKGIGGNPNNPSQ